MPVIRTTAIPGTAAPVRGGAELAMSLRAIGALIAGGDERCGLLGRGARYAARVFLGEAAADLHGPERGPVFTHVPSAIERAGRAAVGDLPWHETVPGDAGRIVGRGAEEWLAWAFIPGYPLPMWLVPGLPASEVHRCVLGDVGAQLDTSTRCFVYDVVDHMERVRLTVR